MNSSIQHEREIRELTARYERIITDLQLTHERELREQAKKFLADNLTLATGKMDSKTLLLVIGLAISAAMLVVKLMGR